MKTKSLFATQVSESFLPGFKSLNPKLLKEISDFRAQDKMGQQWSKKNYRGGYTSYASLSDMHHRAPAFMEFSEKLQTEAEKFAKALDWDMRGLELEMTACWFNVMAKETYHTLHLHPHSVLSGAYYVSAPRGSVALKIEDPRMERFMNAPLRKQESLYYEVAPASGKLVLFESWLRHEVPPNPSTAPRVSISFNFSLNES